jgi:hypothetical protein
MNTNNKLCTCPLCKEFRRHHGLLIMDMTGEIELAKDQYMQSYARAMMLTTIPHIIEQKKLPAFREWYREISRGRDFYRDIA